MEDKKDVETLPTMLRQPSKVKIVLRRIWLVSSIVAVVGVIVAIILIASNILSFGINTNPQDQRSTAQIVCTSADVAAYNKLRDTYGATLEEANAVKQNVKEFADTIKTKAGYDTDPTCLYFIFTATYNQTDTTEAKEVLSKLDALIKQNIFIDSRVDGIMSAQEMRRSVEAQQNLPEDSDFYGTQG